MRPPSIPQTITIHEDDNGSVKTMKALYNSLVEYREPKTNRIVIQLFISLPSRKDFPEYFDIIEKPISMYEIKKRIESNYYRNEEFCLSDFKLMFNNCKIFNEDLSQIFKDALKLEELLLKKYDQLTNSTGTYRGSTTPSTKRADRLNDSNHASSVKTSNKNDESFHSKSNHHHTSNSHHLTSTPGSNHSFNNSHDVRNNNGISIEKDNDSNSNLFPSLNTNDDSMIINHSYHNETSIDSSSNLSLTATIEKPKRIKKDPDAPKRRLLTGYIIYAAEVRKEYVDKHPNQDFGFISRLIGNDWKALPRDLRIKYDQRALSHNKKIRERALRDSVLGTPDGQAPGDIKSTTKLSKKKLAKQEQMRQNALSTPMHHDNSSMHTPARHHEHLHPSATNSSFVSSDRYRSHSPNTGASMTIDSTTQTAPIRFVEPPQRKRVAYAENFRRYIAGLEVPNEDLLEEEMMSDRPLEDATSMLGGGPGRHGSQEAALWALRDFMLQDSATMRWSLQPYLCY